MTKRSDRLAIYGNTTLRRRNASAQEHEQQQESSENSARETHETTDQTLSAIDAKKLHKSALVFFLSPKFPCRTLVHEAFEPLR
jgi:hypothetical protein